MPSIVSTGRAIWKIYGLLTFVALGVILFTGLSLWDSVNLALSAISTGGFSVVDGGVSSYHNLMLELLLIPIMIAGALPFRPLLPDIREPAHQPLWGRTDQAFCL